MTIKRIWWILALLSAGLCQEEELGIDAATSLTKLGDGQMRHYKLVVPNSGTETDQYLVLNVVPPDDEFSDPDIFISEKNSRPTFVNSEWKCQTYGQDICVIPRESIKPGKTFYITVYCQYKCEYTLTALFRRELNLWEGIGSEGKLLPGKSRIYKFRVPKEQNVRSITVNFELDFVHKASSLKMFVTRARDESTVPSAENSVKVTPSWLGLTAKIYEGDREFCTDCDYKVLLSSSEETDYKLTYGVDKNYTQVTLDNLIFDVAEAAQRNCYRVKLEESGLDVEVFVKPYSGNPDIYVNPGELPDTLSKFKYSSSGKTEESLIISANDIRNDKRKRYYICIYGKESSAYQMTIATYPHEGVRKYPLACGYTHTMNIDSQEFILFTYPLYDAEDVNLTFTLISLTGDADLYLKQCEIKLDQYGTESEPCTFKSEERNDEKVLKSLNSSAVDMLRVSGDSKKCTGNVYCVLMVGVYGVVSSRFSLTTACSTKHLTPLAESNPFFSTVDLKQTSYFVFTISDPKATSVKIQLVPRSGDPDLYVSRLTPFCSAIDAEYISTTPESVPDTVVYEKSRDGLLNTTYYVSVFGSTFATYSLVYTVTREGLQLVPVELYDGAPYIGSINGSEMALYRFSVHFGKEEEHQIKVFLSPLHGLVSGYVEVDDIPTVNKHSWQISAYENSVIITSKDAKYKPVATYYLLVTNQDPTSKSVNMFTVKYLTGDYMVTLMEGYPEQGFLWAGTSESYKYFVSDYENDITIAVTPLSGDPDLFISIQESNKFPSLGKSDYSSTNVGADSVQISIKSLQDKSPNCRSSSFFATECAIYVTVVCKNEECSYTLQVSKGSVTPLHLIEGTPQFGTVTPARPQFYVVVPEITGEKDTILAMRTTVGKVKAYARYISMSMEELNDVKNYPSKEKHDSASFDRMNTQVLVIRRRPDMCKDFCQYLVGVYGTEEGVESEYSIILSTAFRRLVDGKAIVDTVGEKSFKYYTFRVPCSKCTLSISLVPFTDTDPDLYINKGTRDLPSLERHDFASTRYKGEFLQISEDMSYFKDNNVGITGSYTIGIYSSKNSSFSLLATTSAGLLEELTPGIPVRHRQEAGKMRYFTFESWKKEDIKVSLNMYSGRAIVRANVVQDLSTTNPLDKLPSAEHLSTWSSQAASTNNYLVIGKTDSKFLETGTYIIVVESLEGVAYDISVDYQSADDYTMLKIGVPHYETLRAGASKLYGVLVSSETDVTFSLYTIHGVVLGTIAAGEERKVNWDISGKREVKVSSTDPKFVTGMYYIKLTAQEESGFSIAVDQNTHPVVLSEGQPYSGTIPGDTQIFFFYYLPLGTDASKPEKRQLFIDVNFADEVATASLYLYKNKGEDTLKDKKNAFSKKDYDISIEYLGFNYDVTHFTDDIAIGLEVKFANSKKSGRYEILAHTSGVVSMIPSLLYRDSLDSVEDTRTYELTVSRASEVFIEVTPCIGDVEFFVTSSLRETNDRKYDIKKSELVRGRLFGSFQGKPGNYFITVKAIGKSNLPLVEGKKIWYTIRESVKDQLDPYDTDNYTVEDAGKISVSSSGDEVALSWGNIMSAKTNSKLKKVRYSVFVAHEGKANMQTACGMKLTGALQIGSELTKPYLTWKTTAAYKNQPLVFNVIAVIPEYEQVITYEAEYHTVTGSKGTHWLGTAGGNHSLGIGDCSAGRSWVLLLQEAEKQGRGKAGQGTVRNG